MNLRPHGPEPYNKKFLEFFNRGTRVKYGVFCYLTRGTGGAPPVISPKISPTTRESGFRVFRIVCACCVALRLD